MLHKLGELLLILFGATTLIAMMFIWTSALIDCLDGDGNRLVYITTIGIPIALLLVGAMLVLFT